MLANSMGQRDTFVGTYNYMAVSYLFISFLWLKLSHLLFTFLPKPLETANCTLSYTMKTKQIFLPKICPAWKNQWKHIWLQKRYMESWNGDPWVCHWPFSLHQIRRSTKRPKLLWAVAVNSWESTTCCSRRSVFSRVLFIYFSLVITFNLKHHPTIKFRKDKNHSNSS